MTSQPPSRVRLPLIAPHRPLQTMVWRGPRSVNQWEFLRDVHALAARLPEATHALNLCDDRYRFMIAFAAICLRSQTNLLPPSQAPGVIREIAAAYPGSYAVGDTPPLALSLPWIAVAEHSEFDVPQDAAATRFGEPGVPSIPEDHIAAQVFTSGSTGAPQAHAKTWRTLVQTAQLATQRFFGSAGPAVNLVATVPPQHMYGLETTVMMALAGGCATQACRPFFPADLRTALQEVPEPRVLITTPIHLRAFVAAARPFPPLRLVISATAPLDAELAAAAEAALGAPVHEIYGCTEAGSMASRHTISSSAWQFYPGMSLSRRDGVDFVHGEHLVAPVAVPDRLEDLGQDRFRLCGRGADVFKLAGKRGSLAELTARMLQIPGVQDAVAFVPEPTPGSETRPAALVVAPELSDPQILAALETVIDAVFLPRPLIRLPQLPRNAVGKLPRAVLLAELERLRA